MGQRRIVGGAVILAAIIVVGIAISVRSGGDQAGGEPAKSPRVASITPAGTSLVAGIGAGDHLVGVSTFDLPREGFSEKPKIGDYQSIDWEKLAPLRPEILLTQFGADRFPTGLRERCGEMNIKIVNVHLDLLADIYRETQTVADAVGEGEKGQKAVTDLKAKLDAVRRQVAGRPAVRAIVVTSDSGLGLAGPGEFLDELLTVAGGENAAAGMKNPYLSVDREQLMGMGPEVVIQLIPDGDKTPQVMTQAARFWEELGQIPAVRNHRVRTLTAWYALEPGLRVGELAKAFADILHPETIHTETVHSETRP